MVIKFDLKKLLISLLIPLGVGGLATLITSGDMKIYDEIKKPPLSPPSWLFPVVWVLLYILLGASLYLFWRTKSTNTDKSKGFILFGIGLFLNFLWTPVFFSAKQFFGAIIILVMMIIITGFSMFEFCKVNKTSVYLQIPYIVWLLIALYLNIGVYILN